MDKDHIRYYTPFNETTLPHMNNNASKKKSRVWIQCPKCVGHGQIPLSPVLATTLSQVARHKEISTIDLVAKLSLKEKIEPTALNNRLVALFEMGFVDRRHQGRSWIWRALRA